MRKPPVPSTLMQIALGFWLIIAIAACASAQPTPTPVPIHTPAPTPTATRSLLPLAGLVTCGLFSSIVFFLVTNLGVWLWFGTYEPGLQGLWHSYVAAIPFFRYTLAGDLFFAVVLFGSYALALSWVPAQEPATEVQ